MRLRAKISIALAAAVVLLAAVGLTLGVLAHRHGPSGRLEVGTTSFSVHELHPPSVPRTNAADRGESPCWLNFGGNPQRSSARAHLHLGRPGKTVWAFALDGYIEFPPAYCGGRLYVNTYHGTTYAVDAKTGRFLWRWRGGGNKPSAPAIDGPRLLVASTAGTVTSLDRATGRPIWQLHARAWVESSPVVVGKAAYFASQDGRVFAVDARTGHVKWVFDTGGRINSSPSIVRNRLFITTYAGGIFALRRTDGHKVWSTYVKRSFLGYESFYASASTDGVRVFTVGRGGTVVALSVETGRVLWTQSVDSWGYSTPAIADGRVFVGGFDGALRAYRAATGRLLWRRRVGGRILGPPVVVGNLVFCSTLEERTYGLRVTDGKLVWRFPVGKYSPGIATSGHYYFSLNGILVAFRPTRSLPA